MATSEKFEDWETRQELLDVAGAADYPLSGSQLSRLHRAGLIERPVTRSMGRGRGKVSFYPPGTMDRLRRVLEVRRDVRAFDDIAWRLWWEEGGAVPAAVRRRLLRTAQDWERERARLGGLLAGEDAGDPQAVTEMDLAYAALEFDRAPAALGRVRRNVGPTGLATVFRVLAEVVTGRFHGYEESPDDAEAGPGELFEQALGIDRARSDRLDNSGPWFEGSSEDDLRRLCAAIGTRSFTELAHAEEVELDAARVEVRSLWSVVLAIVPIFERVFGSRAFGFGTLGAVFRGQPASNEAFFVLMWLALREDAGLREGMVEIAALVSDGLAVTVVFGVLVELREEIPAFAEIATNEVLAAAMRDGARQELLSQELGRFHEEHGSEVARVVNRHPELDAAMAVFESAEESRS